MESSGVPAQGVIVNLATTAKKRGDRGIVGDHTKVPTGRKLKRYWKACKHGLDTTAKKHLSLKEFARLMIENEPDYGGRARNWLAPKAV